MRRVAVVAIAVALLASGCARGERNVLVGAVYPTAGGQGPGGVEEYRGVRLAAELVNSKDGVNGRKIQLALQAADSAEGVPDAVRSLAKRTNIVLGSYGSTLSTVAARVAAQRNVVFWETGAVGEMPGKLPRAGRFFRVAPTGASLGADAARYARDHLVRGERVTFGVTYVDDVYGRAVGGGAIAEIKGQGSEPLAFAYKLRDANYDAIAKRIKNAGVDVLVVAAYIDDGVALRRAVLDQHVPLRAMIGTSSSYCMPEFGHRLGKDAIGVYASDKPDGDILRTDSLKSQAVEALEWARSLYRSRYHEPMPAPALAGFAGAWALFKYVLPNADGQSADAVARVARAISLEPGSLPNGSGLHFDPNGDNERALSVIEKWVAVETRAVVWPPSFEKQGERVEPGEDDES